MKKRKDKLAIYIFLFIVLIILRLFGPTQPFFNWTLTTTHYAHSIIAIAAAFIVIQILNIIIKDVAIRKIARYIIYMGAAAIVFFIFQDMLIAVGISLGIIAVVLTFIFQTPILSFVGWIYLTIGQIYKEGDRIRISNIKGDIISVNPIRTKVMEVGGEYVQADLPSGKLVTFPNSMLLSEPVSNYSKYFPYIWVDIPFHLTYETDFGLVMKLTEEIIKKHTKAKKKKMQESYEKLLRIFEITEKEFKLINFNLTSFQSWIEFRVTFPVDPKEQSTITTNVTQEALKMFRKHPNKVRFPRGRAR
jgi:small-conductance mechanosensitive channel